MDDGNAAAVACTCTAKKRRGSPRLHSQEPARPPGVEGLDRISSLPDAILGEIVSLLPTKEAGRTQALATRWRHVWRAAPLNLECHGVPGDTPDAVGSHDPGEHSINGHDAISRILSAHPGPGRRLRVPAKHMRERPGAFRAWLMSPALDGLQELELYQRFDDYKMSSPPPPLPGSAFRFSSTLRVATFGQCHISDGPAGKSSSSRFHFPGLKMLALEDSTISEPSLQGLLAGCPVLENLLLKGNVGFRCVRITARSITAIGVHVCSCRSGQELKEVIVEDAPCLERLLRFVPDREVHVSVISAPKLHTLGCLTNMFGVTNLKLDTAAISGLNRVNFTTAVRSVKDLALSAFSLCLDEVINFMGCFPCLERLYIKSGISGGANLWRRKHKNLTKWLDIRLRYIVLANYRGTRSQVSFATFFILNARMLESMRFAVKDGIDIDGGWIEDQHRRLMVEKKASRGAKFDFCENKCRSNSTHVENVRDLSITDPFECTC